MTWSNHLQPTAVTLVQKRVENGDTATYSFALPENARGLIDQFRPGQFNMISAFGVGEAPISVSGVDRHHGIIRHTIRHVGNVTFSLSRLSEGSTVFLRGPYGAGWPVEQLQGHYLVFLTGGIGLAPLVPAIQEAWQKKDNYLGIELLFGARTPADRLFHGELANWIEDGMTVRQSVDVVPEGQTWNQKVGFVTEFIPDINGNKDDIAVLMCGPEIMMKVAARLLKQWGLRPDQIYVSLERRMKCGLGTCGHCQVGPFFVCKDGPVFSLKALDVVPVLK